MQKSARTIARALLFTYVGCDTCLICINHCILLAIKGVAWSHSQASGVFLIARNDEILIVYIKDIYGWLYIFFCHK